MQKIGVNKSKNTIRKYFEIITENKSINIENIKEINSIIIKSSIKDIDVINNSSKIKIVVNTDIKIIYLKENDPGLYVHNPKYINYKVINLPKVLQGHLINNKTTLNKLKKEIYVENINAKILTNSVLLGYFLSIDISIPPTHSIAYSIDNGFGENIFLSHIDGQVLTQKTFNQNTYCKNLIWNNNNELLFISSNLNSSDIFSANLENKFVNKSVDVNISENINNFVIINKNEILCEYNNKNKTNIYKLNQRKNQIKKLVDDDNCETKKPYYNSYNKEIYFLMKDDENYYLYSIDKSNNRYIIFNYVNVLDYYVSYYLNNIIVKVFKDDKINIFEVNIESKFVSSINIDYKYKNILDIKYLYDLENKKQILILLENTEDTKPSHSLVLYDLNKYNSTKILEDNIIKFDIDYNTLDIFIIIKKDNLSYVKKINLKDYHKNNTLDIILKLPASINDISLKRVDYEK